MAVRRSILKKTKPQSQTELFQFVQYEFEENEEYIGRLVSADFKDSQNGKRFVVKVVLDKYRDKEFCLYLPVDNSSGSLFYRFCYSMELLTDEGADLKKLITDKRQVLATMKLGQDGTYFVNKLRWVSKDEYSEDEIEETDEDDEFEDEEEEEE